MDQVIKEFINGYYWADTLIRTSHARETKPPPCSYAGWMGRNISIITSALPAFADFFLQGVQFCTITIEAGAIYAEFLAFGTESGATYCHKLFFEDEYSLSVAIEYLRTYTYHDRNIFIISWKKRYVPFEESNFSRLYWKSMTASLHHATNKMPAHATPDSGDDNNQLHCAFIDPSFCFNPTHFNSQQGSWLEGQNIRFSHAEIDSDAETNQSPAPSLQSLEEDTDEEF